MIQIGKLSQIEIVDRIAASLANLPMGIGGDVAIVFPGDAPSYIHVNIEAWEQADKEANFQTDIIDQTFWADSWSINDTMSRSNIDDILNDIEEKVLAYHNYHQKTLNLANEWYEKKYGECAEWLALDKSKMQIIAMRKDYYNNFRDQFYKDENVVILKAPNDVPF